MGQNVENQISPVSTDPSEDSWFQLEIDNDTDVLKYIPIEPFGGREWIDHAPRLSGKLIHRVKLVSMGKVESVEAAKRIARVTHSCRCLQAQGLVAFQTKFPRNNGRPVAFGGNYWGDNDSKTIAYLLPIDDGGWQPGFREAYFQGLSDEWLWAIVM